MFKKITSLVVALVSVFSLSLSASATSLGYDLFYLTSGDVGNWSTDVGDIYHSTGGTYKLVLDGMSVNGYQSGTEKTIEIQLWEDDGSTGDDHVKTWYLSPSTSDQSRSITNASDYTDGLNGDAEFYIKFTGNFSVSGGNVYVRHYD